MRPPSNVSDEAAATHPHATTNTRIATSFTRMRHFVRAPPIARRRRRTLQTRSFHHQATSVRRQFADPLWLARTTRRRDSAGRAPNARFVTRLPGTRLAESPE